MQDLERTTIEDLTGVIDIKAEWCGSCRQMKPLFEEAANSFDGVDAYTVDVDSNPELAESLSIQTVPTFVVSEGTVEERRTGTQTRQELSDLFDLLT